MHQVTRATVSAPLSMMTPSTRHGPGTALSADSIPSAMPASRHWHLGSADPRGAVECTELPCMYQHEYERQISIPRAPDVAHVGRRRVDMNERARGHGKSQCLSITRSCARRRRHEGMSAGGLAAVIFVCAFSGAARRSTQNPCPKSYLTLTIPWAPMKCRPQTCWLLDQNACRSVALD